MVRFILAGAMFIGTSGAAFAAPHNCAAVIADKLSQLKVREGGVQGVVFDNITEGGRSSQRVIGYNAWVELKQCRGSVVVRLATDCEIEDAYTKGACAIPGLKSY